MNSTILEVLLHSQVLKEPLGLTLSHKQTLLAQLYTTLKLIKSEAVLQALLLEKLKKSPGLMKSPILNLLALANITQL